MKFSHTRIDAARFLALSRPYGVADFGQVGVGTSLRWDVRNRPRAATRGAMLFAEGNYYPSVWSAQEQFGEVHGEAARLPDRAHPAPADAGPARGRPPGLGPVPGQRGRLHRRPGHGARPQHPALRRRRGGLGQRGAPPAPVRDEPARARGAGHLRPGRQRPRVAEGRGLEQVAHRLRRRVMDLLPPAREYGQRGRGAQRGPHGVYFNAGFAF